MCELYSRSKDLGLLHRNQYRLAEKAQILLYAFAATGLDGLIDEATGFKSDPKYRGLRVLINQYLAEGLHHVDAIGKGRDRTTCDDSNHEKMSLCRQHHVECHKLGQETFNKKYKVYGIIFELEGHKDD